MTETKHAESSAEIDGLIIERGNVVMEQGRHNTDILQRLGVLDSDGNLVEPKHKRSRKMNILQNEIEARAIIHGEIIILPVDAIPTDAVKTFSGKGFIAGHSETGHHHVIEGTVTAYKLPVGGDTEQIFFRATKDTNLKHLKTFDRHADMPIYGGRDYVILKKNEYDPFADVIRQVRD